MKRKLILALLMSSLMMLIPIQNVTATDITFTLVRWDSVPSGTNSGVVDDIVINGLSNGDINEVVTEGWQSLPNCYEIHDDDQNSHVWFNLSNYAYISEIVIHLRHYTGSQGIAVNKGRINFYDGNTRVMALNYSWQDDGWRYKDTVGDWIQISPKQNFNSWRTDVLTITHNSLNNMTYDIDGTSVYGTTCLDGVSWFSFDRIQFTANSTNALVGGYGFGFAWRIDDFNITVSDYIGFSCDCPADLITFDCPDEYAVVNQSVGFPYYIYGEECSGATFRLKNSTFVTVDTETRGEGFGVVRWNVDWGYGLGTWYIIAYDCYTGNERLNCSFTVVSDSGVGNYDIISSQDVYSVGDYVSFLVLAPDGEIITIEDDHINYDYSTTFEGTGFYEELNNVFELTKPQQNLCFQIINETNVITAYDCIDVIEEFGYYNIKWKQYLDADDTNTLTSGDTIKIYGTNGFSESNDNVFLIAYKNTTGTPTVFHSWQMNNYGNTYEFLYMLTGNVASNQNDLFLRMAVKDWVNDEYTYIDDYYVTVSYRNFVPPDEYDILPPISQPLGSIIGFGVVLIGLMTPFLFAGLITKNTGSTINIPTFVYALGGGTGMAVSVVLGLFPSWVIPFLIAIGIISIVIIWLVKRETGVST